MKTSYKILAVALAVGSMTSCADLDTEYLGGYVNTEQKETALEQKPALASASVAAIASQSIALGGSYSSDHFDFGYPAINLGLDSQTADMAAGHTGYNWFLAWESLGGNTTNGYRTIQTWNPVYSNIKICNDLLATIPADTENGTLMFYRAQGLANRAFDYWMLANLYQFNVQRHPDALCVPILTDENVETSAAEGTPRATTTEVYAQIIKDLNEAITLLSKTDVKAEQLIADKPKRLVSLATAYGLRARAHMSMGLYKEAAADAQAAINNFNGAPASIADVSKPTFCSLNEADWMWGFAIAETDGCVQTGIINWPSMACTFAGGGYVTVGAWRYCAEDLYLAIPATDVRKGWFVDANYTSPNLNAQEQAYVNSFIGENGPIYESVNAQMPLFPYTNVKFAAYNNVVNQQVQASDLPRMRVEEMYYILAEAQGFSQGVAAGKTTLENFEKAYRNPAYVCKATTAEELQEAIFQIKRVELWGEGLMYYEYMRLNKGIDRRLGKFPYADTFNLPAESPCMIYLIPQSEINANKQITTDDNNPSSNNPTPVPWGI